MYESMLVAVDGSDPAGAATRQAVAFAERFDAALTLVSVLEEHAWTAELAGAEAATEPRRSDLDDATRRLLDDAETRAADAGVEHRTLVERGAPHEVIAGAVDRVDADLIAMGTHGRTGVDRVLLGSVAERVLRTVDVPVLAVRTERERTAPDSILLPTDGSACAERAIDHAVALAARHDATLHLLSVVDVKSLAAAYGAGPATPDVVDELRRSCERALEDAASRVEAADVPVESTLREAAPGVAIEDYVEDRGIDLVAMGTHGRSGLPRHLLGSVAERTLRTSEVPVLAVPCRT